MYNKNFKKEPTEKQKIGQIGEDSACKYLENKGFSILDRNYLKKWGELDIVAKKGNSIHFVEVKSVSRSLDEVTRVTPASHKATQGKQNNDSYNPEDNMHPWKLKRLSRAVQSYLLEKDISDDVEWQFDLATVYVDLSKKTSRVFLLEDIVL